MACAHPWLRYAKKNETLFHFNDHYIPCGHCLNCRVDKQNQLTHRCEQELINFKCGSFVTVTYDDYNIVDKLTRNKNNDLVATLKKSDSQKFIKRLRQNIKSMPDNLLCNHKFKYLVVGEYGGDGQVFDRPHMHFLFFGLDFAMCKKLFAKSWKSQGIIEVDPILEGGIRYVLKYLDKQLFGNQAIAKYDDNNLERPFQCHSLGLGSSLYKNQLKYIKSHNGCYRWKGKDIPVPPYYRDKYLISKYRFVSQQKQVEDYKLHNIKMPNSRYDLHDFQIRKAGIREENINVKLQQSGRPRYDYMAINDLHTLSQSYINDLVSQSLIS